jgi:hypothetical protein
MPNQLIFCKYHNESIDGEGIPLSSTYVSIHTLPYRCSKPVKDGAISNNYICSYAAMEQFNRVDSKLLWARVLTEKEQKGMDDPGFLNKKYITKFEKEEKPWLFH